MQGVQAAQVRARQKASFVERRLRRIHEVDSSHLVGHRGLVELEAHCETT